MRSIWWYIHVTGRLNLSHPLRRWILYEVQPQDVIFIFPGSMWRGPAKSAGNKKNLNTYRFGILQNQRICGKARGPKKLDTTICRNSFISQVFKPWHGNRMHNIHKCSNKWYFCFFYAAIATLPSPNLCKYLYIINSILYSYHLNVCDEPTRYSFRRPFCDKCWFLVWRLQLCVV